jgi:cytochrome c oxidase cbb3-type subunit 4
MKFINYLKSIGGVSVYPMATLMLFALFFAVVLYWVLRANSSYINKVKQIPLDDHEEAN